MTRQQHADAALIAWRTDGTLPEPYQQPANDGRRESINPIIAAYLGSCTGLQAVAAEGVLRKLTEETGL
jgi:hypothetical protein